MHIFLNVTGKEPKEMELAELIEKVLKKKEGWDKNLGEGKNLGPEEDTSFMAARIWAGGDGEGKRKDLCRYKLKLKYLNIKGISFLQLTYSSSL